MSHPIDFGGQCGVNIYLFTSSSLLGLTFIDVFTVFTLSKRIDTEYVFDVWYQIIFPDIVINTRTQSQQRYTRDSCVSVSTSPHHCNQTQPAPMMHCALKAWPVLTSQEETQIHVHKMAHTHTHIFHIAHPLPNTHMKTCCS